MSQEDKAVPLYSWLWWNNQIERDEKRLRDNWWNYADKIVKKYKDKRDGQQEEKRVNLFWTNVGILKAALYAKPPKPMVSRTWLDFNDNVARVSAEMLQRCLGFDLMKNVSPMSEAIKLAVEDRLIPGLGMIWHRYVPTVETQTIEGISLDDGTVLFPNTDYEVITDETIQTEYVPWRDFIYPSARVASEVWYIGRKLYKSKGEIEARFGKKIAAKLKDQVDKRKDDRVILPVNFTLDKVEFYELWCKKNRKVYWWSRFVPNEMLEVQDDPLGLDDFYPCPMPLMATHTTDDYLPRPDYYMVKDQYDTLNSLTSRIYLLEKAIKVIGVYNKKNAELKRLLTDAAENDMIPVDNWAMLAEGGGLKGQVDWFPIEQVVLTLEKLSVQKKEKIEEIYMLTGISDIMRGDTNARETLGAQQIKAQFGSVRLQYLQDEVANFVKQALIIKAEIICRHFQPESIIELSSMEQTPDAQYIPQAIELLKNSEITHYRIDINEESLALPDYNQERDMRVTFLTTVGQFISQTAAMAQAVPGTMPYFIQMIRWVAAGFKGSSEIQGVLDQAFNTVQNAPPGGQGQPPDPMKDPKVIATKMKTESDQKVAEQKHQTAVQQGQLKVQDTTISGKSALEKAQADFQAALVTENIALKNDIIRHDLKMKEKRDGKT